MKRTQIKRRPMADSVLSSLEAEAQDYREVDIPGLYFRVKSAGNKSWLLRYKKQNGKWAWKGLGGYPAVSGKAARDKARVLQQRLSDGESLVPVEDELFSSAAENWYEYKVRSGRKPATLKQYRIYLDGLMLPHLGHIPLKEVTRADCTKIQETLEERKAHSSAKKVRGWLSDIFSRAIAQGKCDLNPASELRHVAEEYKGGKYPWLKEPDLPTFFAALSLSNSGDIVLPMVWLVIRTACRPGMARLAEWTEFDLDKGIWIPPVKNMKTGKEYTCPLATQTINDLLELKKRTGLSRYLFPGNGWKYPTMSDAAINACFNQIGYKNRLVGHGCRHTMSTLLREHGWDRNHVEAQLAHTVQGVEGVYNNAEYIEKRRTMMQWYADHLDTLQPS